MYRLRSIYDNTFLFDMLTILAVIISKTCAIRPTKSDLQFVRLYACKQIPYMHVSESLGKFSHAWTSLNSPVTKTESCPPKKDSLSIQQATVYMYTCTVTTRAKHFLVNWKIWPLC